jgi:hypothetical protein
MNRSSLIIGVVIGATLCRVLGSFVTDVTAILAITALVQLTIDVLQQQRKDR